MDERLHFFTYSNALGLSTPVNLSLTNVNTSLNSGTAAGLSFATQNLNANPIAVSAGNNQGQSVAFSITSANLLSQFVQTGNYTVPLTLTTSDARASPIAGQATNSTLTVNVADMQSLVVNDAVTTITLNSIANYQGVSQSQPNHLTVSSTSPWSLAVKTAASTLTGAGSDIPAGFITAGNTPGQTLLTAAMLSSANQTITSAQPPVIARTVGVLYSISAANAAQLISKPSDTYTTTVTYVLSGL